MTLDLSHGRDDERPVAPLPATLGEAVEHFHDVEFAPESFDADVAAHCAEAGRREWGQFLPPGVIGDWERRRSFDVIWREAIAWTSRTWP